MTGKLLEPGNLKCTEKSEFVIKAVLWLQYQWCFKALTQNYKLKQSDWVNFANRPSWPISNVLNLTVALREVGGLGSVWSVLGGVCMPSGILVSDALCLEPLLLIGRLKCTAVAPASGSCRICVRHGLLHEATERPPGPRVFKDRPETYTYIQSRC